MTIAHGGGSRQGVSEEQIPLLFLSPRLAGWRRNEGLSFSAGSDRSQLVGPRVRRGLRG